MDKNTAQACDGNCSQCKDDASALIAAGTSAGKQWEYFQYSTAPVTVGAGLSVPLAVPTYPDSYMVIKKLMATGTVSPLAVAANAFSVLIYNSSTGRTLQNIPVNAFNLFGGLDAAGNMLPAVLKDPIILPPSSNIQIQLLDLSGAPNRVQLTFAGYRWFNLSKPPVANRSGRRLEWFQNALNVTLAANGGANQTLRIDSDADFLVRKIMATQGTNFAVQISDSASKDQWSDQLQDMGNIAGKASFPFWLPKPKLVTANSSVSFQFQDLSGAGGTFQVVLEGAKVYR